MTQQCIFESVKPQMQGQGSWLETYALNRPRSAGSSGMTRWTGISSIPTTFRCAEIRRIGTRRGTKGSVETDGINVGEIGPASVPVTIIKKPWRKKSSPITIAQTSLTTTFLVNNATTNWGHILVASLNAKTIRQGSPGSKSVMEYLNAKTNRTKMRAFVPTVQGIMVTQEELWVPQINLWPGAPLSLASTATRADQFALFPVME